MQTKVASEQALAWSGLPVVTIRPTVFLEGFFLPLTGRTGAEEGRVAGAPDPASGDDGRVEPGGSV